MKDSRGQGVEPACRQAGGPVKQIKNNFLTLEPLNPVSIIIQIDLQFLHPLILQIG
jgi:hypothetical protein